MNSKPGRESLARIHETLVNALTVEDLFDRMHSLMRTLGWPDYLHVSKHKETDDRFPPSVRSSIGQGWVQRYLSCRFDRDDPRVHHGEREILPMFWDKNFFASNRARQIYDDTSEGSRRSGLVIPVHCPEGQARGIFSFDSTDDVHAIKNRGAVNTAIFVAVLTHDLSCQRATTVEMGRRASGTERVFHLSRRESEVLGWYVEGKTAWEISLILGISENTVYFHYRRIKEKCCAQTMSQAVAKIMSSADLPKSTAHPSI